MRTLSVYIAAVCLVLALGGSMVLGADDHSTVGFYWGLKGSQIEVDVPKQGKKRFSVTDKTIVNNVGLTYSLKDIPKYSNVKIVDRDGTALLVIVLEVSK